MFIKNGYEKTSIQQIVDNLGGLTKGAIFHHFKSKDEILKAVSERISSSTKTIVEKIRNDKSLTGLEKLRKLFQTSIESPHQDKIFTSAPMLLNNPNLLAIQLREIIEHTVPNYIQPIIEEGIADGSIKTDYPKELGEVMILLSNVWLNPLVYSVSVDDMINKIKFFDMLLNGMGINILDNNMYDKSIKFTTLSKRE